MARLKEAEQLLLLWADKDIKLQVLACSVFEVVESILGYVRNYSLKDEEGKRHLKKTGYTKLWKTKKLNVAACKNPDKGS